VEERLVREGSAEDPRTVALFLATRSHGSDVAVQLAQAELKTRADIMTHAANALALAGAGKINEALVHSRASLAEGTVDARLFLCAGHVAARAGQPDAAELLERAGRLSAQLLPSEQRLLQSSLSLLPPGPSPKDNKTQTTKNKTS
jgi:Tfp pilus assembly major pilin PilA